MRRRTTLLAIGLALAALTTARAADIPQAGEKAPDVKLPAVGLEKYLPGKKSGDTISLKDFQDAKGKNVVLYFYPKAMTRGCTIESCGFRDLADKFAALDTVVIGISTDTLDAQQKFTDKEKLNFPLIADANKDAVKTYGALSPRGLANRYTFVIDKQGMIRRTYLQVDPAKHPEEVLKFVKENLTKG